jgi:hypothetical protein
MIIHDMPQRSEEWLEVRRGKFTASDFDALMPAKSKPVDSWTKTQLDKVYRVAAERMTGQYKIQKWTAPQVEHGEETEDEARIAYEFMIGQEVRQVGFIERDEWIGCSPDGLVEDGLVRGPYIDGGLEIKCPNSDTHLKRISNPNEYGIYDEYPYQVQGNLWIAERAWWDCLDFDPRFVPPKDYYCVRVYRDEALISLLDTRLKCAILKVKEIMEA